MTGADIARAALSLRNTPYHHGQAVPGVGIDCIGVVRAAATLCGLVDPFATGAAARFAGYTPTPNPVLLREACDAFMDPIAPALAAVGDVLVFRFVQANVPQHFGIVTRWSPRYFVHSHMGVGKVVEHILDIRWMRRIVATYRLRGVT